MLIFSLGFSVQFIKHGAWGKGLKIRGSGLRTPCSVINKSEIHNPKSKDDYGNLPIMQSDR
jgi:hypothetical protein